MPFRWSDIAALLLCLYVPGLPAQEDRPAGEMVRAVEEFQVQTRSLGIRLDSPARKAAQGGVMRSWHGRVYENFRNDILDAMPHEIVQRGGSKNLLRRHQFGLNVAGPAFVPWLPRMGNTFFSLSYEGVRERISRTSLRTIPTVPERTGDYSAVVDQAGEPLPIYDPSTTRSNPAYDPTQPVSTGNLQYSREPFPENRIPARRLDPVAQRVVSLYPEPNADAGPFFRNNYFINAPETNTADGMIGKVDQSVRGRHRLSMELAFSNGTLGASRWFPSAANPGPVDRRFSTRRGSFDHVFTANSRTVNTGGFEVTSSASRNGGEDAEADYGAALGLAGIGTQAFPRLVFSPYMPVGQASPVSRSARNTFQWTDVLSTRAGRHSLRFTGLYSRHQVNTFSPEYPAGSFYFSSGLTSLPGIVNTGHAFAGFLLGLSDYASRSVVPSSSYFRNTRASISVHDRYELGSGLTLSLGLDLERYSPRTEKFQRQSTVDLTAINPVTGLRGVLAAAGRNGYGEAFRSPQALLSTSAGVAWMAGPATVARASFARSYAGIPIYNGQWGTQGFAANPTFISANVQLEPAVTLSRGLPPLDMPLPYLAPGAADDTVADLVDTSTRLPTYQSASFSLERQLPGALLVTAGASYSGGRNLLVDNGGANPNAIPLEALQFRDSLNDEEFNASLRPYPQYKGFDLYSSWPGGRYQREAAFLRVEKRASAGLSMSASYELSKQMDDYSGPYGKQDFHHRENEWARNPWASPQYLQLSYMYELPVGSNRLFLSFPDWRKVLVDGWSVSGTALLTGGGPIYLTPQFNNTGGVVQALHVNAVPGVDAHVPDQGPDLWFNPAAFDQPPDFTIGNVSRTLPGVFNPGYRNYDLSLNKRVPLAADRTLEFSAAGFNFINHANWNAPDNVIGPVSAPNVNAGRIIGSRGGRVIQLGLRLSF